MGAEDLTVLVHEVAVDEGGVDGGLEGDAFKRRPSAVVENILIVDGVGLIWVNDGEVGVVSFADETAVFALVDGGGVVCHFFGCHFGGEVFE